MHFWLLDELMKFMKFMKLKKALAHWPIKKRVSTVQVIRIAPLLRLLAKASVSGIRASPQTDNGDRNLVNSGEKFVQWDKTHQRKSPIILTSEKTFRWLSFLSMFLSDQFGFGIFHGLTAEVDAHPGIRLHLRRCRIFFGSTRFKAIDV